MSNINVRTLTIDCDQATVIAAPGNDSAFILNIYKGTEYVLQANCYGSSYYSDVKAFNTISDSFSLYIGRVYGTNAAPVLIEANVASWNNVADWSACNVVAGAICVRINTSNALIDADLGNLASRSYTMEFWGNNSSEDYLISQSSVYINNVVE